MKSLIEYASLCLEDEKKRFNTNLLDLPPDSMRKFTDKFVDIKNNILIKPALEIAKKIKNNRYELKVKAKIDEINLEIRH
mmetsp:Transcript_3149/g.2720  ORF Transcript_3149/g.2720 Transcript_3149/m.2720 type:complete len:80 (+) Transcript_3149:400-639(+)